MYSTKRPIVSIIFKKTIYSILYVDGTDPYSSIAFILAIIFVAIANVLLLNVLVALFK